MLLMLKGSKVVFVTYVHNIDTFNAMSKGSKDHVMLKQGNKHVEGVKSQNNFRPLQHT